MLLCDFSLGNVTEIYSAIAAEEAGCRNNQQQQGKWGQRKGASPQSVFFLLCLNLSVGMIFKKNLLGSCIYCSITWSKSVAI